MKASPSAPGHFLKQEAGYRRPHQRLLRSYSWPVTGHPERALPPGQQDIHTCENGHTNTPFSNIQNCRRSESEGDPGLIQVYTLCTTEENVNF